MKIKNILPIILLLTLAIGVVACRSDDTEKSAEAPAVEQVTETAHDADAEPHDAEAGEAEEREAEHQEGNAGSDDDEAAEHDESAEYDPAVPPFVAPKPAQLDLTPEALAFAMGDPEAPVQIIEFTDYQCPFCKRHALETVPGLIENLVDSGRVFYGVKDLPLEAIHPAAKSASIAARCAGEQEAYLEMHDAIFEAQVELGTAGGDFDAFFAGIAADLALDAEAFDTCVVDGRHAEYVQANLDEARALGINGTPFSFVNGYGINGAQPYETFEMAVELAESGELGAVVEAQARQMYEAFLAQQAVAQQAVAQPAAAQQPSEPVEVSLDDAFAIGDPDAPVTIVEYIDYQCPFCAWHSTQTFNQIAEELVETGRVRYIFKDLPLTSIHPQATLAAEAARCAGTQDGEAYVAMHDMLFAAQIAWSGKSDAADTFASFASEIGIDGDQFASCLENHDMEAAVQADMLEAQELGFGGTPAFLINGQPLMGAQPFEVFQRAVDSFMAQAPAPATAN